MILKINKWFGRLGNNLIQMRNVILIALFYNYNIMIPYHKFFKTTQIILNKNITNDIFIDNEGNNFFYNKKITKFNRECFISNIDKMKQILRKIFIIDYKVIKPLANNELVIHIRGGDIFSKSPHRAYIPPSLSFYKNIIDNSSYEKIYLINDFDNNPCISKLKELYSNIIHISSTLENDIKILLSASNLVTSIGTFPFSLLFLTNNVKNIYYPSYSIQVEEVKIYFDNIKFNSIDQENYYKKIKFWENTKLQQKLLLL